MPQDQDSAKKRQNMSFLLKNTPLFSGLSDPQLAELASLAQYRKVPRHQVIVQAGEGADALFVLVSGRTKVQSRNNEGREVILSILVPGDCFGEMALIDGALRSADVIANENCELLVLERADFEALLTKNAALGLNIMKNLVLRLRQANRKIESLALVDVYGRVARVLLELAEDDQHKFGRRVIPVNLNRQDIAKMVGASREMVSRVMTDLTERGYLRVEDGRLVLMAD